MKFGLRYASLGRYTQGAAAVELAQAAEAAGFDSIWTVEHVLVPDGYQSRYPYSPDGRLPGGPQTVFPDPLLWMAHAAAVTIIGADVKDEIFPGLDPINRTVLVHGYPMRVIGVQRRLGKMLGQARDKVIFVPITFLTKVLSSERGLAILVRPQGGMAGLDRVLGGGFVAGSVVLLAGEPGRQEETQRQPQRPASHGHLAGNWASLRKYSTTKRRSSGERCCSVSQVGIG